MKFKLRQDRTQTGAAASCSLDGKLAGYLAASASIGAMMASDANAIIVSNTTVQNVGINGIANIDFNSDGQIDFQIDHDRVDLTPQGGSIVDYLQIDKNDINSEIDPLPFDPLTGFHAATFPPGASVANDANNSAVLVQTAGSAPNAEYPTALIAGAQIGPNQTFDFQEGGNVYASNQIGRLNRLIDEDHGQVDIFLGGKTPADIITPHNTPQFVGIGNEVRYLGVKMDLNNANSTDPEDPQGFTYGWIGIKITNEADATAQVTGWGYETTPGTAINAGDLAPGTPGDYNGNGKVDGADYVLWRNGGPLQNETFTLGSVTPEDYTAWRASFGNPPGAGSAIGGSLNAVPEPSSLLLSLGTGFAVVGAYFWRRIRSH